MKGLLLAALLITQGAASPAVPANTDVSALSWLSGTWRGTVGPVEMEEVWTEARGGTLLGVHRDVRAGRTVSWEFLRIAKTDEGIVYFASPGGRPPVAFRLTELADRRAVFSNPEHDFPQRILYWVAADGALHARIEGGAGEPLEWRWERQ